MSNRLETMTREINFLKGHGAGNDFVIVDAQAQLTAVEVAQICDRHFGLGADGLLRVAPADEIGNSAANWFMDYRNADGSLAQTCGNGLRVFARHLVESGREAPGHFLISTRGGDVSAFVDPEDTQFNRVAVSMGTAQIAQGSVHIQTSQSSYLGTAVSMANPHCVVELPEDADFPNLAIAPSFSADDFPEGVNIEFIKQIGENRIFQRTYERGSGETLACGSGACAAASVYAQKLGLSSWTVHVELLGGVLEISSNEGALEMIGPARIVATGTYLVGNA